MLVIFVKTFFIETSPTVDSPPPPPQTNITTQQQTSIDVTKRSSRKLGSPKSKKEKVTEVIRFRYIKQNWKLLGVARLRIKMRLRLFSVIFIGMA